MDYWRTYDRRQIGQLLSGLQLLLENKMLGQKEEETAKGLVRKLNTPSVWDREQTLIQVSDKEERLLSQIGGTLWR